MISHTHHRCRAFTLVEVITATAISAMLFGVLIESSVILYRLHTRAENASAAVSDQERVMDYITRDLRAAYTVTTSLDSQTLTLTIPDCYTSYDAQGNPSGALVDPIITPANLNPVAYNDAAKPITVVYFVNNKQQLIRQQTIARTNASTTLIVSNDLVNMASKFDDLTNIVKVTLQFAPQFNLSANPGASAYVGETLITATSVRNARRD